MLVSWFDGNEPPLDQVLFFKTLISYGKELKEGKEKIADILKLNFQRSKKVKFSIAAGWANLGPPWYAPALICDGPHLLWVDDLLY